MINPRLRRSRSSSRYASWGSTTDGTTTIFSTPDSLGYSNEELYNLSQRIINGGNDRQVLFGEAYSLSYADIYDFSSKKQSLKKFQIELGILHMELDIPWDEPVPEGPLGKGRGILRERRECHRSGLQCPPTGLRRSADPLSCLGCRSTTRHVNTLPRSYLATTRTTRTCSSTLISVRSSQVTNSMGREHHRGEVTGEGGYVYAEPVFTRTWRFWTWRVCIRRVSSNLTSSDRTRPTSATSSRREWQLSIGPRQGPYAP